MSNSDITRVKYDSLSEEYYITIPENIVRHMSLEVGDILSWTIKPNGLVYISKK